MKCPHLLPLSELIGGCRRSTLVVYSLKIYSRVEDTSQDLYRSCPTLGTVTVVVRNNCDLIRFVQLDRLDTEYLGLLGQGTIKVGIERYSTS
jgi:hypothetical protein